MSADEKKEVQTEQSSAANSHIEQAYTSDHEVALRANAVLLNHENLSYGSSGLKGIMESPYVCAAAFLASMGGFSFGYGTYFIIHM